MARRVGITAATVLLALVAVLATSALAKRSSKNKQPNISELTALMTAAYTQQAKNTRTVKKMRRAVADTVPEPSAETQCRQCSVDPCASPVCVLCCLLAVLIITDDQSDLLADTTRDVMPQLNEHIFDAGERFTNYFVSTYTSSVLPLPPVLCWPCVFRFPRALSSGGLRRAAH